MAYSIERLRQAIDIFNGGASQFFALPLNPYNLRERGAKRPEMLASWHDDSGDEDYDPAKGQVQKRPRGPVYQSGNTSPRMMRKTRSLSLSLQANMNMDSGLEAEGDDPIDPDNFHSEPEPEPDVWEKRWAVDTSTSPNTRYQLRPRSQTEVDSPTKAKCDRRSGAKPLLDAFASSPTPKHDNDPTQGCEACLAIGQDCSLRTDPNTFAYPCAECEHDDLDCVVTPEPKWKRSCEECRRCKSRCSYRFADYDHGLPCHSCLDHGYPCIAGPARHMPSVLMPQDESSTNGSKADESDEDKVAKFDNVEPSGFHKSHPIEAMTISYNDHDTEDNNPHFITQESKANLTNRRHLVNQRTVEFGKVRRIQTMFAHPIHLAGDPDYPREGPHCNWCSNFAYGVVGLGIRNPEVIDFGTKMVEIEGGHTGEGKYETRMCLECVCHRIKIIQCTHASVGLLRLPGTERGASEEIEEYGRFIRACNILTSQSTQATGPSFSSNREWCGICQKPAAWTCKTPQGASIGVAIIDCDELQYGCGLHLCDLCRETLSRCRGNLNSVYDNYAGEQGVLRADVEFILSGAERNVLYKRMLID